jgi:shikimate dehydrogenase
VNNLYGLIGEKLKHSISPQIHSIIFKMLNINGSYHLFELDKENLKDAVLGLKVLGAKGVNVTIPYKTDIIEYVDEISDEASRIGAINTINFIDGKTIGYNTDYYGFGLMMDKYNIELKNKDIVILGTGGAAKAVLQYFLDSHANSVTFVTRDINNLKINDNDKRIKMIEYKDIKSIDKSDIVVNCTPCGMYPNVDNCPIGYEDISKFSVAVDLIYNPEETVFLKHSKELGLKYCNGLYMLVGQAVVAQEIWNNVKIGKDKVDDICSAINDLGNR